MKLFEHVCMYLICYQSTRIQRYLTKFVHIYLCRYIAKYICTNVEDKSYLVRDASRSFPSGHASISVYGSLTLAVSMKLLYYT